MLTNSQYFHSSTTEQLHINLSDNTTVHLTVSMMQSTQKKAHCIMRVYDVKFVVTTHHNFQHTKENPQTLYHQEKYGLQERKLHL